ncbi:hypothetical protein JD844_021613 [Phrynosoma platyrhinos]|uniref:Uncharacterized protein n=1 Tax=Phrynosoma platyrhinos TaxID=52577 RepID=A0ABQ7SU27_PHRPL|nr:hypothetical protein JD844_021613 [Phrynosoma platyrhinos]
MLCTGHLFTVTDNGRAWDSWKGHQGMGEDRKIINVKVKNDKLEDEKFLFMFTLRTNKDIGNQVLEIVYVESP